MTSFRPGDLVLVAFPYTGSTQVKRRPAMVLLDVGDADVVQARITTQRYQTPHDVDITDWQGAGLLAPSVVRLHKLVTLDKSRVLRYLGALQSVDQQRVSAVVRRIYGTW